MSFAGRKITETVRTLGASLGFNTFVVDFSWLLIKYCICYVSAPFLYRTSTDSLIQNTEFVCMKYCDQN